jgi:hypothetical protein
MTKLSDTQLVILGAAAQRADLSVLPLPDSLKLKGGAQPRRRLGLAPGGDLFANVRLSLERGCTIHRP